MELSLFSLMLAAGLTWALAATSFKEVQAGYFRSCVLVVLGLLVLSLLAGWSGLSNAQTGVLVGGCFGCYFGFVCYSLERSSVGHVLLGVVSLLLFTGLWLGAKPTTGTASAAYVFVDSVAGSCLLGVSMASMLLGHYYLTAPWMSLEPLKRMVAGIWLAALFRAVVEGWHFTSFTMSRLSDFSVFDASVYFGFRWAVGVVGPIVLATLTWQTLKLKATQAATGILYVVVIFTLIGEVTGVALRQFGQ